MEITGKIIHKLEPISGTAKATGNPWKKQDYVLETLDSFPKKVHFDFFGEKADQFPLNVGDVVTLSFDIESREYQGRWYTSIRGWKSVPATQGAPAAPAMGGSDVPPPPAPDFSASSSDNDDLPF